jgi:hypothetical protein
MDTWEIGFELTLNAREIRGDRGGFNVVAYIYNVETESFFSGFNKKVVILAEGNIRVEGGGVCGRGGEGQSVS